MNLQPIACALRPAESLVHDYRWAVLHVAWNRNTKDSVRTLLFAWIELLPTEMPPPVDDGEHTRRLGDNCLHVHHVVMTASRALEWYRSCADGIAIRPETDGSLNSPSGTSGTMSISEFDQEPPWPNLVCSQDSRVLPFLAHWQYCPRVSHLIPRLIDIAPLWRQTHRERAENWLQHHFQFNFREHPNLWGSIHLVAPNPIFREVRTRLEQHEGRDSVLIQVQARAGRTGKGLRVRFVEERPTGRCVSHELQISADAAVLEFDHVLEAHYLEIHDEQRGLLYWEPLSAFFRSFSLSVQMATVRRIVEDGTGQTLEIPIVNESVNTQVSVARKAEPSNATNKLFAAKALVQKRAQAEELEQRWFEDEGPEAVQLVRSLIGSAMREILIVDPYFTDDDLQFALSTSRALVTVRVLTSWEGLRTSEGGNRGIPLSTMIDKINQTAGTNPIAVRVMKASGIHDRFIVVDDRVFHLGSSLNSFGTRGTMLIRVPYPEPIVAKLSAAWNRAAALSEWLTPSSSK